MRIRFDGLHCDGWAKAALLGVFLGACSGSDPVDRPDPEICDDGVDNDGDGAVDCDDSQCGGLPCQGIGDDDDDDTTGPPPTVEIVRNPDDCCDFLFTTEDCPSKKIGDLAIINRSVDVEGQVDAFCDRVGPESSPVIQWNVEGTAQQRVTLINAPLPPESSMTLNSLFVCATGVNQDFYVECTIFVEVGEEEAEEIFTIVATTAQ